MSPPEYHLESFWDDRFKAEHHFEWLGDGSDTIIPVLRKYLQSMGDSRAPSLLHIGAGTSTLSDRIAKLYEEFREEKQPSIGVIVNSDYSEVAVEKGRASEERKGGNSRWERVDLLCWPDIQSLKKVVRDAWSINNEEGPFEIIIDKRTSDAISCNDDVKLRADNMASHVNIVPVIESDVSRNPQQTVTLEPVELLVLHLAALVRPGGIWIVLSYSRSRFGFLNVWQDGSEGNITKASRYWKVEEFIGVDAPSGSCTAGVFVPAVQHYVVVLRRTKYVLE